MLTISFIFNICYDPAHYKHNNDGNQRVYYTICSKPVHSNSAGYYELVSVKVHLLRICSFKTALIVKPLALPPFIFLWAVLAVFSPFLPL
jgi:hypothetical protein